LSAASNLPLARRRSRPSPQLNAAAAAAEEEEAEEEEEEEPVAAVAARVGP
jgi:hypothetical protein